MIDESNPAGRLFNLLTAARNKPDGSKIRDMWAKVLDCDPRNDAEISLRVLELYKISQEVQTLIKLIPELNHDLYLASFNKIDKAIFPLNLEQPWRDKKRELSADLMTRLQFCAEELGKYYSEETLAEEDLQEISQMVSELYELIVDSSIDPSLRLALLEELSRIRFAISTYRIKGARGVKEALQSLLGSVIAHRETLRALSKDEMTIPQKLGCLVNKLDTFTSKALKIGRILSGPVAKALDFLSNSAT